MKASPPVDTLSARAHRRQLAWQILVPFLILVALVIILAVLVATKAGSSSNQTWSDISIIWLIAPMLIFSLLFVFLLGFLIYGIARLTQVVPHYTGMVQGFFNMLPGRTRRLADGTVKPFVWFQQAGAVIKSIFKM
jgi:membrane-associated HD superfamily phosphohydrolase